MEQVDYTPYPAWIAVGEIDGVRFFSAALKMTYAIDTDGTTIAAKEQQPLTGAAKVTFGCSPGVISVAELVAFRKKAEVYLRADGASLGHGATVRVGTSSRPVFPSDGCPRLATPSDPFLVPYLAEGEKISIEGIRSRGAVEWQLPYDKLPFVLIRYEMGAMIPTPMRADLVVVDVDAKQLEVVYRATFPVDPQVRKVEFRITDINNPARAGETKEEAGRRTNAELAYLRKCAVPALPPEPCSLPTVRPPIEFFMPHAKKVP
jgi:hypothetical protein